jgi:hypothetical protein
MNVGASVLREAIACSKLLLVFWREEIASLHPWQGALQGCCAIVGESTLFATT